MIDVQLVGLRGARRRKRENLEGSHLSMSLRSMPALKNKWALKLGLENFEGVPVPVVHKGSVGAHGSSVFDIQVLEHALHRHDKQSPARHV